jgi:hypothetical protein
MKYAQSKIHAKAYEICTVEKVTDDRSYEICTVEEVTDDKSYKI